MKNLVVIPTYNEKENITSLIPELLNLNLGFDILVVDDNSPDGTALVVEDYMKENPQVHILKRKDKEGLGKAYLAGFRWGLENKFEGIVEMDADFSHRPQDLVHILKALPQYDFVIGSRYIPGGQKTKH